MALFGKLVSRILPQKYTYVPFNISLHIRPFNDLLRSGDTKGAITFYESLSATEQTLLIEATSEAISSDDFFDDWYDGGNGPALSGLLRGALLIKRAWFHRGSGRGKDVSEAGWKGMENALRQAIESLKPILHNPIYGCEANARCIRAAKGLGLSWDQLNILLENMRQGGKLHLDGELDYLVACCEKWLGSHDKMFEHAFSVVARYPHSPETGAVMAAAHFERLFYYAVFDQDVAKTESYMTDAKVLGELRTASRRLMSASSHDHPDYIVAHNIFAGVFYYFDCVADAKPHFEHMGEQVLPYPWRHFSADELQLAYTHAMRA